jgi:hypothetical protein
VRSTIACRRVDARARASGGGEEARIVDEPASVPGLLQNAAAQVARITHIEHGKILRYRPERGDLLVEASPAWSAILALVRTGFPRLAAQCKPALRLRSKTSRMIQNFVDRKRAGYHRTFGGGQEASL